jgi:alcohol dehydrogenase (cytochrome c)
MSNCTDVTIDTEKHNKEKGWNGGSVKTADRYESDLTAADPVTGEIRKSVHLRYANYSGALATAGGLVFLGLTDGTVAAFDDTTLAELWKINVGSAFSAPPMTFEVAGRQYVAIVAGPSPQARLKNINTPELKEQRNATVLYVFAL